MSSLRRSRIAAVGFAVVVLAWSGWMARADSGKRPARGKKEPKQVEAPIIETPVVVRQEPELVVPAGRPNGSLWNAGSHSLLEDVRARRVGDLLTIIVQESTVASSTASTKTDKSDSASFGGGTGFLRNFLRDFGASAQAASSGNGTTTRSGSLNTRLTVIVKEVLPNGNLAVEGAQSIKINKETQKVIIRGIVRPQDVAVDNSVLSPQVAEATIEYDGKGPVGDRQKKGILSRLFDLVF